MEVAAAAAARPLARPSVLPPGRHHAGAHLPPAGLVPLALLEGGDGADARGAAVLGQDHLRQCHRGERPPACPPWAPQPASPARRLLEGRAGGGGGGPLGAAGLLGVCVSGERAAVLVASPSVRTWTFSRVGGSSVSVRSAVEELFPFSRLLPSTVSLSRPGFGRDVIGLVTFLRPLGGLGFPSGLIFAGRGGVNQLVTFPKGGIWRVRVSHEKA